MVKAGEGTSKFDTGRDYLVDDEIYDMMFSQWFRSILTAKLGRFFNPF